MIIIQLKIFILFNSEKSILNSFITIHQL